MVTLTLLLDLDDTLLGNDIDRFLPAYLERIGSHLAGFAAPRLALRLLLEGTQHMLANRRPDCTLQEVFDGPFFAGMNSTAAEMAASLADFYTRIFPELRALTRPLPAAAAMAQAARQRGYQLAIATNPLFPRTAIEQRLEWAGLGLRLDDYADIPSYEVNHFAKPHPEALAEILGRMGWTEGPVVMVGDNLADDVACARRLGLPAYWVTAESAVPSADGLAPSSDGLTPSGFGPLSGLLAWVDAQPAEALNPQTELPSALLAWLRAAPAVLDGFARRLPADRLTARPDPSSWSLTEIFCHLRDVEREVNLPRLQLVLAGNNPFLPGKDTDPWALQRGYQQQDGLQALHSFTAARLQALKLLEDLPAEAWNLPARHAIFGPSRLRELVKITTAHDRLHLAQARLVSRGPVL